MRRAACLLLLLLPALAPAGRASEADATARTREAAAHLEAGRHDRAVALLERVLRAVPASRPAARNLALALSRRAGAALLRKDGAVALEDLDRALELHPGRLAYGVQRARALLLAGRAGAALRQAQEVVARSPAHGDGWRVLADVRERQGDLTAAVEALERLAALRPGDDALGRRLADLRRRAEAEATFLTHGTGNFIARYPPDADADLVRLALTILEDAHARVTSDLGISPRTPARVVLYEGAEFQRVTGSHSWVAALYQGGVLRVPTRNLARHRATAERVLAHEFTHHVLRERTPSLPLWWHEGIAQFVEDGPEAGARRRRELGEMLRRQDERSRLLTLAELRRLKIAREEDAGLVHLYYGQALHFVGWLVDRFGAGALPSFLTALGAGTDVDAAAQRAFGADVAALHDAWLTALRS